MPNNAWTKNELEVQMSQTLAGSSVMVTNSWRVVGCYYLLKRRANRL
jgi:hypothetical protein